MSCLRLCAVGGHGRKGSYQSKARKAGRWGCTCVPCFFCVQAGTGCRNQPTNPDTMLRPYIPDTNTFYFADPRSVRVCVSSSAVTRTPAVDNNPASKAPKSGNGRLFSELGAEHLNSSRRSCVTYFFSAVPHPFFSNNSPTIIIESPGPTECRPAAQSGAAEVD